LSLNHEQFQRNLQDFRGTGQNVQARRSPLGFDEREIGARHSCTSSKFLLPHSGPNSVVLERDSKSHLFTPHTRQLAGRIFYWRLSIKSSTTSFAASLISTTAIHW